MKKTSLFSYLSYVAYAVIIGTLAGCASTPELTQTGDQEAKSPQTQQAQQQVATLANPTDEINPNDTGDPTLIDVMTREEWLQNLKDVLSTELCTQDEIFRTCYPVSELECRQHIQAITASCANRYQVWIPEKMHEAERRNWDQQVGECTGGAMSSLLDAVYPLSNAQSCQEKLDSST